jgi:uncharacterized protein
MDYFIYLLAGALAGVLSGLFGVGGGLIIVPILTFLFARMGFPEQHIMHMALGTSLASIIFTSISSTWAHHNNGHVDWMVVRRISAGVVLGTLMGATLAASLLTYWLIMIFAIFVFIIATQLTLSWAPNAKRRLPGRPATNLIGAAIGALSSLVGIGGGTLSVPILIYCNIVVKRAIGTSAAIGLPIAIAGTLGFAYQGWKTNELPAYSLGYVYLPAVIGIVLMSIFTAPLGVKLAHRLAAHTLKKAFALLLYLISLKMIFSVF